MVQGLVFLMTLALAQGAMPPGEESTPYGDCVVLGASERSNEVLVAQQVSENVARLVVWDKDLKEIGEDTAPYPWKRGTADLGRVKQVRQLLKKHNMKAVEKGEVEHGKKAMVSLRYEPQRKVAVLVLSDSERELDSFSRKARLKLRVTWRTDGKRLFLSGYTGTTGFFKQFSLKPGKALARDRIRETYLTEARLFLKEQRYRRCAQQSKAALGYGKTAESYYLLAVAEAYRQRWEDSRKALRSLEALAKTEAGPWLRMLLQSPLVREATLRELDINGDRELTFKASKGFEGTSVWVKIKDKSGTTVAAFKPTNGNTYHRGEVFTYQMSKLLGTEGMYPVTILYELDKKGCDKLVKSLKGAKYKGMKERNRKLIIGHCQKGHKLEGAVKEWVSDFQFLGAIGTQKKLKKHSIYRNVTRKGARPESGKEVKVRQITRLYKPDRCKKATYMGTLDQAQFARDLSDMMVMDVLNANEDRFPGANVDFKSLEKASEDKDCVFDFGKSRLFSLDNGATFKGSYSNGWVDLKQRVGISRFRKGTYRNLKKLQQFIEKKRKAPTFLRRWGIHSIEGLWKFLALDKGDDHKRRKNPHKLFITNLNNVLGYMEKYVNDRFAWFD